MTNAAPYACAVHLVGEQVLPLYIGMKQVPAATHLLAATADTRFVADHLRKATDQELFQFGNHVEVPPYERAECSRILREALAPYANQKICFNLTGGTKPMFVSAYQVGEEMGADSYYVETTLHRIDWLRGDRSPERLQPAFRSVNTFFELQGFTIAPPREGFEEHMIGDVVAACWKHRSDLAVLQGNCTRQGYTARPGRMIGDTVRGEDCSISLNRDLDGTLTVGQQSWTRTKWIEVVNFACGGWFEALVYQDLKPLLNDRRIVGLQSNVELCAPDRPEGRVQEIDVAFTDGLQLTLVECKAGEVKQEHVQKLENLAYTLGGTFGRGILASIKPLDDAMYARIERSRRVAAVTGEAVRDPESYLHVEPGTVLGKKRKSRR